MSAIETMPSEPTASRSRIVSGFEMLAKAVWSAYAARRELRRTRLHLFELSDAELRDIGLTREVAEREASRSLMACYLNSSR